MMFPLHPALGLKFGSVGKSLTKQLGWNFRLVSWPTNVTMAMSLPEMLFFSFYLRVEKYSVLTIVNIMFGIPVSREKKL